MKISVEEALKFAEENYPQAPEKLAELLQIEVRRSALNGDGWCLRYGSRSIIRINNQAPATRQRFTLAHELGHLLLHIPSVVGSTFQESFNGNSAEEKQVNLLAARMLLPTTIARREVPEVPISLTVVKRLAKNANVSEPFVARRLTSLWSEFKLLGAAVVYFENGKYKWSYSEKVSLSARSAESLLAQCQSESTKTKKIVRENRGDVVFAGILPNPHLSSQTLFVQKIQQDACPETSREETLRALEAFLFENMESMRHSLQGCLGAMKNKVLNLTIDEAMIIFNERYLENDRWNAEFYGRVSSEKGQEYLRLRLQVWTL